ncbi:DUF1453 domain-containing protein [Cognatilysobacter bugurensis]|uniref:DUF1453 domain-containing protein n=1 Tax=Cognatilysobacter bugurensis TaxID=543356 RepID=A0A918W6Y9_9GAMM|nr:DUF1453 domain-containing protein [Lysobacter bugurensis]GHA79806.1 hypothetical protein GCM10007067_16720 [Lysobacter bugurensis]
MPLLLIPAGFALLVALWLVLLPLGLWQRYRRGRAQRLSRPWSARLNLWSWGLSLALFLAGAAFAGLWIAHAFAYASGGVLAGVVLGLFGWRLARVEPDPAGLRHTPNGPLVLGLTVLLAARIAMGLWQLAHAGDTGAVDWLARQAGLLAVGGLLLGHQAGYAWSLNRALARRRT